MAAVPELQIQSTGVHEVHQRQIKAAFQKHQVVIGSVHDLECLRTVQNGLEELTDTGEGRAEAIHNKILGDGGNLKGRYNGDAILAKILQVNSDQRLPIQQSQLVQFILIADEP